MNKSRFWLMLLGLSLALSVTPRGWAQFSPPSQYPYAGQQPTAASPAKSEHVCKIYHLRDFADNDELCQWIADAIPEVIQPGTWQTKPQFNSKVCVLAICQTPKAHAEVDEFLKNLKAAVLAGTDRQPAEKATKVSAKQGNIVPARYSPPVSGTPSDTANPSTAYLVPPPLQHPKHLFHFVLRFEGNGMDTALTDLAKKVSGNATDAPKEDAAKEEAGKAPLNQLLHLIIRYEGEGIIDSNVNEFMKLYQKAAAAEGEESSKSEKKSQGGDSGIVSSIMGVMYGAAAGAGIGAANSNAIDNVMKKNSSFIPIPISLPTALPEDWQPLQGTLQPVSPGPLPAGIPYEIKETRKMPVAD